MSDRNAVKKFFKYELDNEKIKKGSVKLKITIILVLIAVGGGFLLQGPLLGVGLAAITFVIGYMISYASVNSEYKRRLRKQKDNHCEFESLLRQTRSIMGNDLVKAFMRVFERTMIDREQLRVLEKNYSSSNERDLLTEETLEEKLGDLMNKSIRLISKSDFKGNLKGDLRIKYDRLVREAETEEEYLFNPMRLVVLFLTETQLVICDIQIDSIGGDLREEIQRISLSKIVNVHFAAERMRNWSTEQIVQTAINLGYDANRDWLVEERTSKLFITRTDGGALEFPIRVNIYFGEYKSALDEPTGLSEDEISVDRMINELNRLVEHAK